MRLISIVFLFFILSAQILFAQDSVQSEAFKDAHHDPKPTIRAKYPSYPLIAGYLLVKEANNGDPFAEHELALRYLLGQGFPADTVKALYWIKKAVDQNLPSASFNYGIMLYNGIGVPWNPFEAYENFKQAADAGLPEGLFAYGVFFTDNLVVNRNLSEAYKLIKRAADAKYEPAIDVLKEFKKNGLGFVPDSSGADTTKQDTGIVEGTSLMNQDWDVDYLDLSGDSTAEKAADDSVIIKILNKNSDDLKKVLGITKIKQSGELKDTSGIELIQYAAKVGSPEALMIIGKSMEKGVGLKKNIVGAAMNYIRSYRLGSQKSATYLLKLTQTPGFFDDLKTRIDAGDADAMFVWAGLVAMGFDYSLSDQQAFELLEKADKKNHIPSIIEIGLCYYSGTLVKKDRAKAMEYWQKASRLGSREASVRIAFTDILDNPGSSDIAKQIVVLENASDEGSVLAETALGYCYEKGIGVKLNKGTAAKLYREASHRGNETAYNSLKKMYDELRPGKSEFKIYNE